MAQAHDLSTKEYEILPKSTNTFYSIPAYCKMPIIIIGVILTIIGILSIYSVSIYESFTLTISLIAKGSMTGDPSNYFYFLRQLRSIGFALIMAGIVYRLSIKFFQNEKNMTILAIILMVLQIAVFIPGIGITLGGAR